MDIYCALYDEQYLDYIISVYIVTEGEGTGTFQVIVRKGLLSADYNWDSERLYEKAEINSFNEAMSKGISLVKSLETVST